MSRLVRVTGPYAGPFSPPRPGLPIYVIRRVYHRQTCRMRCVDSVFRECTDVDFQLPTVREVANGIMGPIPLDSRNCKAARPTRCESHCIAYCQAAGNVCNMKCSRCGLKHWESECGVPSNV